MKTIKIITLLPLFLPMAVFAQNYLTEEQEQDLKLSGRFYWGEGDGFNETKAYQIALNNLTEKIISDDVPHTKKKEEILKELEKKARVGRIKQEGMVCVLAWIAKDSVWITTQKPFNPPQVSPQPADSPKSPPIATSNSQVSNNSNNDTLSHPNTNNKVNDAVLQELLNCKDYKDVNKVANRRGLVRGDMNSAVGFDRPELCYIAVFNSNWSLVALLDKGGMSRTDLLSGQSIQQPESYYRNKGYYLWYLQKK